MQRRCGQRAEQSYLALRGFLGLTTVIMSLMLSAPCKTAQLNLHKGRCCPLQRTEDRVTLFVLFGIKL
jgi:hypothetical protein